MGEGIVVSGSGGGVNLLLAESSSDAFPLPYRVLYHAVDLSARRTNDESVSGPVDEGSLVFAMVNRPDAPIPEGYYMEDFLRQISRDDRAEIRHAVDRLERERYVEVQRAEGQDTLWVLTPTALARGVIANWRRIRMQYLERVGRSLQDELTAQGEAAAKRAASVQTVFNISGGSIGLLNAGNIEDVENIAVNVNSLQQTGNVDPAEALKSLTEATLSSSEISSEKRQELLDLLSELSEQASLVPEQRKKPGVLRAFVSGTGTAFEAAGGLAAAWATWGPAILHFFGV